MYVVIELLISTNKDETDINKLKQMTYLDHLTRKSKKDANSLFLKHQLVKMLMNVINFIY